MHHFTEHDHHNCLSKFESKIEEHRFLYFQTQNPHTSSHQYNRNLNMQTDLKTSLTAFGL